jgi:hypothetical protein
MDDGPSSWTNWLPKAGIRTDNQSNIGCTFQLISSVTSNLCIGGLLVLEGFSDILDQKTCLKSLLQWQDAAQQWCISNSNDPMTFICWGKTDWLS